MGISDTNLAYNQEVSDSLGIKFDTLNTNIKNNKIFLKHNRFSESLYFNWVLMRRILASFIKITLMKVNFGRKLRTLKNVLNSRIIVFIPVKRYSGNAAAILNYLASNSNLGTLVVNDLWGEKPDMAKISDRDFLDLSYCYSLKSLVNFFIKAREILKIAENIYFSAEFGQEFRYGDINLGKEFKKYFKVYIFGAFLAAAERLSVFEKAITIFKPKLIINCNDIKFVSLVAKKANIPCVSYTACTVADLIEDGPVTCDKVLVSSDEQKDLLISKGCPVAKIYVVGEPRFDYVDFNQLDTEGRQYREKYNINDNEKIILFLSTYGHENDCSCLSEENMDSIFDRLYAIISNLKEVALVTKMHPYETNADLHISKARSHRLKKFILEKDFDLWVLIRAADLVVDIGSAAGIDAIVLKRPLITISPVSNMFTDLYSLQKYGLSRIIYPEDDLEEIIRNNLFDRDFLDGFSKKRESYLREFLFDGKSTQRAAGIITSFLKHNNG